MTESNDMSGLVPLLFQALRPQQGRGPGERPWPTGLEAGLAHTRLGPFLYAHPGLFPDMPTELRIRCRKDFMARTLLAETRGYEVAWIGLGDGIGAPRAWASTTRARSAGWA